VKGLSLLDVKAGAYLMLSVADNGHGMDPETVQRIFEPYFSTKEVYKGTGLGLAVVHGIVKRHGGGVLVRSKPGRGTVFDVFLPAADAKPTAAAHPDATVPGGRERILLVDDDQTIAGLQTSILTRYGYQVTPRTSGRDALDLILSDPHGFDLLITDYTMPRMTGLTLAMEVLKVAPDMPIILCTGFSEQITEEEAKERGIKEFAMKPIEGKQLARLIRKVLDAKKH
jgi:CheY-like chemotaxis protein